MLKLSRRCQASRPQNLTSEPFSKHPRAATRRPRTQAPARGDTRSRPLPYRIPERSKESSHAEARSQMSLRQDPSKGLVRPASVTRLVKGLVPPWRV